MANEHKIITMGSVDRLVYQLREIYDTANRLSGTMLFQRIAYKLAGEEVSGHDIAKVVAEAIQGYVWHAIDGTTARYLVRSQYDIRIDRDVLRRIIHCIVEDPQVRDDAYWYIDNIAFGSHI